MKMGEKIRELRRRDGRTQEALARELGVSAQAISRWEKGICYPDMDMLPPIANYFGVTIDELFGYDSDRDKRVGAAVKEIEALLRENNGVDVSLDRCISLARRSLIEFPGNERLTLLLASSLYTAGYVRQGEFHIKGGDGFSVYDTARHRTYPEWQEAMGLFEKLLPTMADGAKKQEAAVMLAQLYKNTGEREKALQLAENAPDFSASKPLLRINAYDGREAVVACGEALVETAQTSAELMERIVLSSQFVTEPQTAADMLSSAASLFDLICPDGNYGRLSAFTACLHMLRSYFLWLADDRDGAFDTLDKALTQARRFDELRRTGERRFTSPLLFGVSMHTEQIPADSAFHRELPEVWPWWDVTERNRMKAEMEEDARWAAWIKKCETD